MCVFCGKRETTGGRRIAERVDMFDYVAQVEVVPIWTGVSLSGLTWRSPYVSGWSSLFMMPLCILAPLIAGQSVCVQIALGELDPLKMSLM